MTQTNVFDKFGKNMAVSLYANAYIKSCQDTHDRAFLVWCQKHANKCQNAVQIEKKNR